MADWGNPEPFQLAALHEALIFAYPTPADFNAFLILYIGKAYAELAPVGENYSNGLLALLWQVRGQGWLKKLVQKARQDRPQSPKLLVLDRSFELTSVEVPETVGRNLEDIVRKDGKFENLMPWVEKLEALGYRTCRIEHPINSAQGTGWLVGPDLLLTNWHVIDKAFPGGERMPSEYVCRFDYAVTADGTLPGTEVRFAHDWCVDASPPSSHELGTGHDAPSVDTLDYALVRLATPIGDGNSPAGKKRGWVEVQGNEVLPETHDIILVIQYPDGLPMKFAIGDISAITADNLRIFHTANTKGGSSGALVVTAKNLVPIGLHHAGDVLYHRGTIGAPEKNQAIPIGRIANRLKAMGHLT